MMAGIEKSIFVTTIYSTRTITSSRKRRHLQQELKIRRGYSCEDHPQFQMAETQPQT
jgi:hypothetical protein